MWGCAELVMGCLEEGPKVGKEGGGDQGGLGRRKRGKTEERGGKGPVACASCRSGRFSDPASAWSLQSALSSS